MNTGTGLISGTPTAAGTSTVTLSATNGGGTGNATLTLTITAAAPVITSATTASGTVGNCVLLSDHGDELADQLQRDRIAGGLIGEHRNGTDLRDTDGGGNIDGDVERDQRRRDRQRHSDADGHRCGAGDHQRDDGERDGGKRVLLSDHGDEHADELRRHRIAGGVDGEHRHGIDLRDTDGRGNIDGDTERDQQRWDRQCHSDADDHRCGSGDHERDDGERDSREARSPIRSRRRTRRPVTARRDCRQGLSVNTGDGTDLRDTDGGGNLDGDTERDQQRRDRQCDSDADDHCCGIR